MIIYVVLIYVGIYSFPKLSSKRARWNGVIGGYGLQIYFKTLQTLIS